ncbi:deoxyribose-phosphate aldolase [Candidatus Aerophobetes bacterium]|nr:deoxyribose-phosphate aldolase [Candidatus Aerophobetes bacterium]
MIKDVWESIRRENLTLEKLAKTIDHSLVGPLVTDEQVREGCEIGKRYLTNSVFVKPYHVPLAVKLLRGTGVKVGTVVGFPHGCSTPQTKAFEARQAVEMGAEELDVVSNFAATLAGDYDLLREDIGAVVEASKGVIVKIILENCYLTREQKIKVCQIAEEMGADFVKTSTGFGTGGASVEDVRLMRETVSPKVGVKAAGGIRSLEKALEILEAGANRIGATATIKILESFKEYSGK